MRRSYDLSAWVVTVTAQVLKSGENGVMIMGLTGVAHVTDNKASHSYIFQNHISKSKFDYTIVFLIMKSSK